MAQLKDNTALLNAMMHGGEEEAVVWRPTSYWRGYCRRITRELDATGLKDVRVNQRVLKGFAAGGAPQPTQPLAAWKRAVWRVGEQMPAVSRIVAEYQRLIRAVHQQHAQTRIQLSQIVIERIADSFPDLSPPDGLANGGAEDTFEWRGHMVTADWIQFLARAAAFYRHVPPASVRSILEVGPGLGLSSLAHIALNPGLRMIVNVDVPPVLYVATQYLRSVKGVHVVDYCDFPESGEVVAKPVDGKLTIYQIAPWQLPRLKGPIDLFHNAYSFQEMEREICANYSKVVAEMVEKHVWLMSSIDGHLPGAGGQHKPIPLEFLIELFQEKYPETQPFEDDLLAVYRPPQETVVISRSI